ncbi:hypothetical protein L5515_000653 [Caenorhabditis briggsae]|uniref:C3H1-type domain-containing protein n=1 Tax=Caenorhabditis briggsae TaxID=6238 RepID=A0AAE9J2K1_CAEBR|nr:hypothetical protein L5515_000653 [Caenorhabditis briggsae]
MTLAKSEIAPKTQENSNTEEMNQQTPIIESASSAKSKPKSNLQSKICDHWRRSGNCSYGDSCWYAHGEDDLRKLTMYRNNRNTDERLTGENDRNCTYGNVSRGSNQVKDEVAKVMKNPDEFKAPLPSKRVSTNVKGLTVNIPQNIAFKDQPANASMPLSPAQERWISMSNNVPATTGDKIEPTVISSSSNTTIKNSNENELEKKSSMENMFERRIGTGHGFRENDVDDYGFLSPNQFPYPPGSVIPNGNTSHVIATGSHQRSISRVPPKKNFPGHFGGSAAHHVGIPLGQQEQSRVPRPGNINCGYNDRHFPSQKPTASARPLREIPQGNTFNGSQPQLQQACWNVAGEIYQRQKEIETCGLRGSSDQQSIQARATEMSQILSKLKGNDLPLLRFMLDRGMPHGRDGTNPIWNELTNNGLQLNQSLPPMSAHGHSNNLGYSNNDVNNVSDCSCKNGRPKIPSFDPHVIQSQYTQSHHHPAQNFAQHQAQHHLHNNHHHQPKYPMQSQQHHMFRQPSSSPFGGPVPSVTELAAPPKIFESLLPSDENFSIWLEPKPKNDSLCHLRASNSALKSNSCVSLLTKMDVLRSEKIPISEEDIANSHGNGRNISSGEVSSSESSSPPYLSLMELLSSENLLEETSDKPKRTMFDFDTLKIAETLYSDATLSGQSSETVSIKKSESPSFFFVDEKTPISGDSVKNSGLFVSSAAQTPSFMKQCDFFAASGSCPFGNGCHLSHSISQE